tara:strand:+ start:102 stop:446 length:345 start_codon:yes stop_codon:yes gene_type:complete
MQKINKVKSFLDETFKDLNFTIYHITSVVFMMLILIFYTIFLSVQPEFILDKNKYYLKHTDFNWTDEDGNDFNKTSNKFKVITKDGKLRVLLFSFIFSVGFTFIVHIASIIFAI